MSVERITLARKVKILKILIIPLSIIFAFSTYQAYYEFSYSQYSINNPPSVKIGAVEENVFVEDVFKIRLTAENIPAYVVIEDTLLKLFEQINPQCKLINISVLIIADSNVRERAFISFNAEALYYSENNSEQFDITDKYLINNFGDRYAVKGIFPEIKKLGAYKIQLSNYEISEGDKFEIELKLQNVNRKSKLPNISFGKVFDRKAPIVLGKAKITRSEGIKGTFNYRIVQSFRAMSPGLFSTTEQKYKLKDKFLEISSYSISVKEISKSYTVVFGKPNEINESFFINVKLFGVPNNTKKPVFPKIKDCKKQKLDVEKQKLNEMFSDITYTQYYKANYYGNFDVDNLIVYVGKEKNTYELTPFEIEFDCYTTEKMRPRNGTEPLTLDGKSGSRRYIDISNNNNRDVFVKIINNSSKKAVRSIYVRRNMKATLKGLPSYGTYFLAVAYGSHWDSRKNMFMCEKSFAVFDDYNDLMPFANYEGYKWTLYTEKTTSYSSNDPKTINEQTFQNY